MGNLVALAPDLGTCGTVVAFVCSLSNGLCTSLARNIGAAESGIDCGTPGTGLGGSSTLEFRTGLEGAGTS